MKEKIRVEKMKSEEGVLQNRPSRGLKDGEGGKSAGSFIVPGRPV